MTEARPYASLSSGLLARKGAAKPAMRPQGYTGFEDLGWNDMGSDPAEASVEPAVSEHVPSSIAALTPAPRLKPAGAGESDEPSVVAQQRAILESFDGEEEPDAPAEPAPEVAPRPAKAQVVPLPKRSAATGGRKSAFTLRLDVERHLRLRLACAVTGRSAQQIVTGALDALLDSLPEVDALAAQVPAQAGAKGN